VLLCQPYTAPPASGLIFEAGPPFSFANFRNSHWVRLGLQVASNCDDVTGQGMEDIDFRIWHAENKVAVASLNSFQPVSKALVLFTVKYVVTIDAEISPVLPIA
jgi:hypothetical protein